MKDVKEELKGIDDEKSGVYVDSEDIGLIVESLTTLSSKLQELEEKVFYLDQAFRTHDHLADRIVVDHENNKSIIEYHGKKNSDISYVQKRLEKLIKKLSLYDEESLFAEDSGFPSQSFGVLKNIKASQGLAPSAILGSFKKKKII